MMTKTTFAWITYLALGCATGCHRRHHGAGHDGGAHHTGPDAARSEGGAALQVPEGGTHASGPGAPNLHKPGVSQEEAQSAATASMTAMIQAAKEAQPDCDRIVATLDIAYAIAAQHPAADTQSSFATFARCAQKKQHWRLLENISHSLSDTEGGQKAVLARTRAQIGLGQYAAAIRDLSAFAKGHPSDPDALANTTLAMCRLENWEGCIKAADQSISLYKIRGGTIPEDILVETHLQKTHALYQMGKFDDANRELDVLKKLRPDSEEATELRGAITSAIANRFAVDAAALEDIFVGLYPYYEKGVLSMGPLVTVKGGHFSPKPASLKITVAIEGIADPMEKIVPIRTKKWVAKATPVLSSSFKWAELKEPKNASLTLHVTTVPDGTVLLIQTLQTRIWPRSFLPSVIATSDHSGDTRPIDEFIAAWVIPNAPAVTEFVEAARKRNPNAATDDAKKVTLPQAQALFEEAKDRGVLFARDPSIDSTPTHPHPVQFPQDALVSKQGNAVDGTVLFASLLEATGLSPVIVRVPGHMFVGWMASKADKLNPDTAKLIVRTPLGDAILLDPTLAVNPTSFESAVLRADAEFLENMNKHAFTDGQSILLSIAKLRKLGIAPQKFGP